MIGLDRRTPRALNPVLAAVYGALLALVIGCACSYVLMHYGTGIVGARGDRVLGPEVFARSGLNLYALQHVALLGAGEVTDALGNRLKVTASIVLPLTVWAAVPAIALMIGGYRAARSRASCGRRAMTGAAIAAGIMYALALFAASRWLESRLDTFLMPEVSGFSANPPQIDFHPSARSALVFGMGFGIAFSYLGALIAVRGAVREHTPGRWWACGKAVVVTAVVLQILIACSVLVVALARKGADAESNPRIVEMLPAAGGLGYAMIHGATMTGCVESSFAAQSGARRAFCAQVNAYAGTRRESSRTRSSPAVWVAVLLAGIVAAFVSGRLAVRWGSRDGSLPTAWRTALLHTAYLALLPVLCEMSLTQADAVSSSTIRLQAHYGGAILVSFAGVFVSSLLGAHMAGKRRLRAPMV